MKRKVLSLILVVLMLCVQSAHANEFALTVDTISAEPGQNAVVNLTFSNNSGIIAAIFELEYDRERLELVKAEDKKLLAGPVFSKTYESYPYIMLWNSASMENFTSDGSLAELTFRVRDNAKNGDAFINLSYKPDNVYDVDLNNVAVRINNGAVKVVGGIDAEDEKSDAEIKSDADEDSEVKSDGEKPAEPDKDESEDVGNNTPESNDNSFSDRKPSGGRNDSLPSTDKNKSEPETAPTVVNKHFDDVAESDWYYSPVNYVSEKGLMNGVSESEFAPFDTLTRAMLVTTLYRNEGEPATNKSIPFEDVDISAYYANAVSWAKQNGIVNGVTETSFNPDAKIKREQIAAIMHRYAQYKGYDVSVGENTNLSSYADFDTISEYAVSSMQYAVGSGLMKGKSETTLNPGDNATRAEIAAVLQRFIEGNK